jgi:hydrogenase-4 component F
MRLEFAVLTPVYVFAMLLVAVSNNLGILWIAVELTTLASVFLVAFHNRDTSLEAAWKFLMLGSLGLGFALLGTVLLFASAQGGLGEDLSALNWTRFMELAPQLSGTAPRPASPRCTPGSPMPIVKPRLLREC